VEFHDNGTAKYHRKALERGADPAWQELVTRRYEDSRAVFNEFLLGVKVLLQRMGLPLFTSNQAMNLGDFGNIFA
jgi:hypothetical protein